MTPNEVEAPMDTDEGPEIDGAFHIVHYVVCSERTLP